METRNVEELQLQFYCSALRKVYNILTRNILVQIPQIARAYHVDQHIARDPLDAGSALLLSDFTPVDGWQLVSLMNLQQCKAALRSVAMFHAFFWGGCPGLSGKVWEVPDEAKRNLSFSATPMSTTMNEYCVVQY